MQFDDAAFLFRLARSKPAAQILEIGRYWGGSAFLFAVASDQESMVTSIDIAPRNDELFQSALQKSGLAHKVQLHVGDSVSFKAQAEFYDLILIDGDHSYVGARHDYEHWKKAVKSGGSLLFHNAAAGRPHAVAVDGPFRVVQEIATCDQEHYQREADVGSLAVFVRTQKAWNVPAR